MPKKKKNGMPRIDVQSAIICDDVRKEANGKDILIGVYSGIIVTSFPCDLILSIWIQHNTIGAGEVPLAVKLVGPHDVEYFQVSMSGRFDGKIDVSSFHFNGIIAPVQMEGQLKLLLKQYDEEWKLIKKLSVKQSAARKVTQPTSKEA